MPETVERDDKMEQLENLSDEEIEERSKSALDRFRDSLDRYFSE